MNARECDDRVLTAGRKEPQSGDTRSAVVFLHGYGANGADLLGLADPLADHLPDTLFVAPDAPENRWAARLAINGSQSLGLMDQAKRWRSRGMQQAVEDLNAFLMPMVDEDLLSEQVCLFGFSQGTMMSLHVAPRREDPVAGIVAFSGRLLEPELLADEVQSHAHTAGLWGSG